MEKRKLCTTAFCIGISALVFILSQNAFAFKYKSAGLDMGLSGSILYTDLDGSQIGAGSGYQTSIYANFDIKKDYLLKIQWDRVILHQDMWNDTSISTDLHLQQAQQRYDLILAGIEKTFETWFWEAFSGFSLGKESSYLVKNSATNESVSYKMKTNDSLLIGGAIGYRIPYKRIHLTARLKTFALLANIYKNGLGDENFYSSLPFLMSIGFSF